MFRNQHLCGHHKWKLNDSTGYIHMCICVHTYMHVSMIIMKIWILKVWEQLAEEEKGKLASDGKAILIHEIHWKTLKITSLNEEFINLISSELSTSSVKLLRNIVLHITILLSLLTCCTKQIYFIFINMCQYFYFT